MNNSLHLFDEVATEEATTELVEEVVEPAEEHLMTAEEMRELDSTLAASGFSEEERKALLAQIQSIEKVDSVEVQDSTEVQDSAVVQEPAMETDSAAAQVETPAVETEKTEASENE